MNKTLVRKVIYLLLMAACLVPLYGISAPSFVRPGGGRSEGGLLTQLREEHGLSQANLGEIDPASESMKLATLGMRGIAANLLWERANEYKKKEQWDNLRATLNQIAKLQPNFISVWTHQAWNLSYNVSVEFDNYEHRYHWVKKGIDFLMEGTRYNRNEPRLLWDLGWFFGHKLGRSDETKQFRRKYNTDEDFHNTLADKIDINEAKNYRGQPDNWLTAHQWFSQAQSVVDLSESPIKGKNPLVFHSDAGKALIRYADAIEEEGVFDEVARIAWQKAQLRWKKYGDRPIPTSYGYTIQLDAGERQSEKVKELEKALADMVPGGEEAIRQKKMAQLDEDERRLVDANLAQLEIDDYTIASRAQSKVKVTPQDMVAAVDPKDRNAAKVAASKLVEARAFDTTIKRYREVVNYIYWKTRCEVEQQDRAIDGRRYLYEANEAFENIALVEAIEKYDEAWTRWASIHRDYPVLAEDVTAEDLVDAIKRYNSLLDQLGQPFPPENFPMLRLMSRYPEEFPDLDEAMLEKMADEYEASLEAQASSANDEESASGLDSGTQEAADNSEASGGADAASVETTSGNQAAAADDTQGPLAESVVELLRSADELFQDVDLLAAKVKYEEAWKTLKPVASTLDQDARKVVFEHVIAYRTVLQNLDQPFPPTDFPLADLLEGHAEELDDAEAALSDF